MIKLLAFKMDNCAPCAMLTPILKELSNEVEFINASEDFDKAIEYNVRKAPTVVLLKDEEEVNRFTGFKEKSEIEELIKQAS